MRSIATKPAECVTTLQEVEEILVEFDGFLDLFQNTTVSHSQAANTLSMLEALSLCSLSTTLCMKPAFRAGWLTNTMSNL